MTQEEMDTILGRTKREYKKSKAELGAIKKRHADLVRELGELQSALLEPQSVYVQSSIGRGLLQAAMESPDARYLYTAVLAERLESEALRNHLDEYRAVYERVESLRRSLIEQGDDDPGPTPG